MWENCVCTGREMCVCVCVCVCMWCVCVCVYVVCVCVRAHVHMHVHVYVCVCMHTCVCIHKLQLWIYTSILLSNSYISTCMAKFLVTYTVCVCMCDCHGVSLVWAAHDTHLAFIVMDIPSALVLPNLEVRHPTSTALLADQLNQAAVIVLAVHTFLWHGNHSNMTLKRVGL